jgi:hypothetical protein
VQRDDSARVVGHRDRLADGGSGTDHDEELPTPRENKTTVGTASALVTAQASLDDKLEVLGTATADGGPTVNISLGGDSGLTDTSLVLGLNPDEARDLAATLEEQADYAEAYHEQKRRDLEDDK